jgi:hypothetical protein
MRLYPDLKDRFKVIERVGVNAGLDPQFSAEA